jgi:hypothetical protein
MVESYGLEIIPATEPGSFYQPLPAPSVTALEYRRITDIVQRPRKILQLQGHLLAVDVENNALSGLDGFGKGFMDYGQSVQSYAQYAQEKNLAPEQVQADLARMVKGDLPESADIIKAILENNPGSDTVMAVLSAEDAKDYALALLTSIPAEKALSLVGKAAKVIDNKILISAAEKI